MIRILTDPDNLIESGVDIVARPPGKRLQSLALLSGGERSSSLEEDRGLYREVNEAITRSWQKEGRHALLHHLNAIFGYEPIKIYVEQMMRF